MSVVFTGTPQKKKITSTIDQIGQLLNLYRLPSETLPVYKDRVLDAFINKASGSSRGLYNGITRELGLDGQTTGLIVDVLRDSDGFPINPNLGLTITPKYLTLYSNFESKSIDLQIDLTDRTDGYFVYQVLDLINALDNWTITSSGVADYSKSLQLEQVSSEIYSYGYPLRASKINNFDDVLKVGNYLGSSVLFSEATGLRTEVSSTPSAPEEYMINYEEGKLHTYNPIEGTVSFSYHRFPLLLKWSPIAIQTVYNPDVQEILLEAHTDDDGNTVRELPTAEGAEIINELISVHKRTWGE